MLYLPVLCPGQVENSCVNLLSACVHMQLLKVLYELALDNCVLKFRMHSGKMIGRKPEAANGVPEYLMVLALFNLDDNASTHDFKQTRVHPRGY